MGLPNGPTLTFSNMRRDEPCAGSYSLDNFHTISGYKTRDSLLFFPTCTWTETDIHVMHVTSHDEGRLSLKYQRTRKSKILYSGNEI
jgi:hypothetical protein